MLDIRQMPNKREVFVEVSLELHGTVPGLKGESVQSLDPGAL